jgi:hypothetical protein
VAHAHEIPAKSASFGLEVRVGSLSQFPVSLTYPANHDARAALTCSECGACMGSQSIGVQKGAEPVRGLWSQAEATYVTSFKKGGDPVLWGCDIEEIQPHFLIRDLSFANPKNQALQSVAEIRAISELWLPSSFGGCTMQLRQRTS